MKTIAKVKKLIHEAEVYRSQGLFAEAKKRYEDAAELVRKNEELNARPNLADNISKKINALEKDIDRVRKGPAAVEIPEKVQDLIKKKFAFSLDKDTADLEGAIALAKFGQFERALKEFKELIRRETVRVEAAKNIFRCHLALAAYDDAIAQYHQWFSSDLFAPNQLNDLRVFLEGIFNRKGVTESNPRRKTSEDSRAPEIRHDEIKEEEFLDICSVVLTLNAGPRKGRAIELDVNFQSGKIISLIISVKNKELIEAFKVGSRLDSVQFYSPIAMFRGSGIISNITRIGSGPKQGDYSLDITIEGP